jgi:hypothetical protein
MIIGLGDYEGGLLDVDGLGQLDVRRQWHRFDGNVPHCTTAVGGAGERFSLIFFTNSSLVHAEGGAVQELQAPGFNVDTLAIGGGLEVEGEVLRRIAAADDGAQRTLVVQNLSAGVFGASVSVNGFECECYHQRYYLPREDILVVEGGVKGITRGHASDTRVGSASGLRAARTGVAPQSAPLHSGVHLKCAGCLGWAMSRWGWPPGRCGLRHRAPPAAD